MMPTTSTGSHQVCGRCRWAAASHARQPPQRQVPGIAPGIGSRGTWQHPCPATQPPAPQQQAINGTAAGQQQMLAERQGRGRHHIAEQQAEHPELQALVQTASCCRRHQQQHANQCRQHQAILPLAGLAQPLHGRQPCQRHPLQPSGQQHDHHRIGRGQGEGENPASRLVGERKHHGRQEQQCAGTQCAQQAKPLVADGGEAAQGHAGISHQRASGGSGSGASAPAGMPHHRQGRGAGH